MTAYRCRTHGVIESFGSSVLKNGKVHRYCFICRSARRAASGESTSERAVRYNKEWRQKNRVKFLSKRRAKGRERKAALISLYGGCCECCGEAGFEFLSMDHIGGGGSASRRSGTDTSSLYSRLLRNGFRDSNFRLLCMNCNFAVGLYGRCPHKEDGRKVANS
jgi:hypothetical protein